MRKKLLLIGIILLLIGSSLLLLPEQTIIDYLKKLDLATVNYSKNVIEYSLVNITNTSYHLSFQAYKNSIVGGNYTVISGNPLSLVCFDKKGFDTFNKTGKASPLFFIPASKNGTFNYEVNEDGIYYIVLLSEKDKFAYVMLSVYLLEKVYSLPETFYPIAFVIALIGVGFVYFSIKSKKRK
ncbi:MAG: hypothetical protein N3F64_05330 [Nitrososphaeria archaeon]|nr:hypothetical protein [Nitrososphaeria archaeon]